LSFCWAPRLTFFIPTDNVLPANCVTTFFRSCADTNPFACFFSWCFPCSRWFEGGISNFSVKKTHPSLYSFYCSLFLIPWTLVPRPPYASKSLLSWLTVSAQNDEGPLCFEIRAILSFFLEVDFFFQFFSFGRFPSPGELFVESPCDSRFSFSLVYRVFFLSSNFVNLFLVSVLFLTVSFVCFCFLRSDALALVIGHLPLLLRAVVTSRFPQVRPPREVLSRLASSLGACRATKQ